MAEVLEGRDVLVTGASSGIGAAVAVEAARRGARLGLTGRREDALEEVAARCREVGAEADVWVADLVEPAAVDALATAVTERFGGADVLVNSAGIPKRRHVTRLDPDETDLVARVNYLAPVRLALRLLPGMLERGYGRIINVSSVAAVLSSPAESAYGGAKAALTVWSETASVDLADTGVTVHVIHPGVVDTPLFEVPDNEELDNPVDPIPVEEAAVAVLSPLETGRRVTYVPEYFADLAAEKARDPDRFLQGVADWVGENR